MPGISFDTDKQTQADCAAPFPRATIEMILAASDSDSDSDTDTGRLLEAGATTPKARSPSDPQLG